MKENDSGEQFIRRLIFLGQIPFIKVPLVVVGVIAFALKTAETAKQDREEKRSRASLVVESTNPWAVIDD